ncbi:hypothetical protein niasHT_026856 [Heterodera trifolii]|uniref:Uncharacterized protein n=1 Tax=Heterodera trifolii TaxID=157864 RepID=A0ABD2JQ88_9BILA
MSVQFIIAGTGPVDNRTERKIVNFNLSHIVKGHLDYAKKMTQVLEAVGVRCTPLSRASCANLSEDAPMHAESKEATERETVREEEKQRRALDESSTVVEHLKHGLSIESKAENEDEAKNGEAAKGSGRRGKKHFIVGSVEKCGDDGGGGEANNWDGDESDGDEEKGTEEDEPIDPLLGKRNKERKTNKLCYSQSPSLPYALAKLANSSFVANSVSETICTVSGTPFTLSNSAPTVGMSPDSARVTTSRIRSRSFWL